MLYNYRIVPLYQAYSKETKLATIKTVIISYSLVKEIL